MTGFPVSISVRRWRQLHKFATAADHAHQLQMNPPADLAQFNATLRAAETALISPAGLPNRPWYKHTIYAPGEYTGYAAVVIPGVNEAIEAKDCEPGVGAACSPDPSAGQGRANP